VGGRGVRRDHPGLGDQDGHAHAMNEGRLNPTSSANIQNAKFRPAQRKIN
jgi:hypothetical protein